MQAESRHPFLRGDALFMRHPEGAVVKDHESSYLVRGSSAYAWLSALSPMMDGSRDLGSMFAELPQQLVPTARQLVSMLADRGTVTMVDGPEEAADRADQGLGVPRALSEQEAFLANWTAEPRAAQRRFEQARIAVLDSVPAEATARTPGKSRTGVLQDTLAENGAKGVRSVQAAAGVDEVLAGDWDWVLATSRGVSWTDMERLSAAARAGEFLLLTVMELDSHLVVGPVVGPEGPTRGLKALVHSVLRNADAEVRWDWWERSQTDALTGTGLRPSVWDVVSVSAAFEVYREITGFLPPRLRRAALFVDGKTLDGSLENLIDPVAHRAAAALALAPTQHAPDPLRDPGADELDDLLRLVSPRAGILAGFEDDDLPQEPLFSAQVRHGFRHGSVVHAGAAVSRSSLADARHEALLSAVAACAAATADRFGRPDGTGTDCERTGGLPADAVVAAGDDAADATERALWAWVEGHLLDEVLRSDENPSHLPVGDGALDGHLMEYLTRDSRKVRLLWWPEQPVPYVMAIVSDAHDSVERWAHASGPTLRQARSAAIDRLAGWLQTGRDARPERFARVDPAGWMERLVPASEPVVGMGGHPLSAAVAVSRMGVEPGVVDITPPEVASSVTARVIRCAREAHRG